MQETNVLLTERLPALRKKKGLKATDVAKALDINRTRLSNWELGIRKPQYRELEALADFLNVNPAYLLGWINDDIYSTHLPVDRTTVKRNDGGEVSVPNATGEHAYSEGYLKQHGFEARQLIALTVDDDSMKEVVCKGDTVLIDMKRKHSPVRDLFAILINGRVWIRWIRPEIDGKSYTLSAEDSSQYPDRLLTREELEELDIIGRVARIERDR
jgi:transcriptional regulator with XRE-family HTH domain